MGTITADYYGLRSEWRCTRTQRGHALGHARESKFAHREYRHSRTYISVLQSSMSLIFTSDTDRTLDAGTLLYNIMTEQHPSPHLSSD